MAEPSLFRSQLLIAAQIAVSVPLQVAFVWHGFQFAQGLAPKGDTMGDRLAFALQWDLWAALVLLAMIMFIAGMRPTSNDVIDGNDRAERLAVHVRIQRNTHEQLTLLAFAHLTLVTLLPAEQLHIIPVLVALFVVSRLIYWIGYATNPLYRTLGFVATFYPSIAALGYAAYLLSHAATP